MPGVGSRVWFVCGGLTGQKNRTMVAGGLAGADHELASWRKGR